MLIVALSAGAFGGAYAKDDGATLRAASVPPIDQSHAGARVQIGLDKLSGTAAALDAIVEELRKVNGSTLPFPKRSSELTTEFTLTAELSRQQLGVLYWALRSTPGVATVSIRKLTNTPITEAVDVRPAVGLILAPAPSALENGLIEGGRFTVAALAEIQAALDVVIRDSDAMAGGMVAVWFEKTIEARDALIQAERLRGIQFIDWVDLNVVDQPHRVPNDTYYSGQWNFGGAWGVNAPQAWDITTGSPAVVVAIIDTGILKSHPDLSSRWVGGYDLISDSARARDGNGADADASDAGDWSEVNDCGNSVFRASTWHGSHVAGIAGAASNNAYGVAGLAWEIRLLPVRVLGRCGGARSDIINGMYWAAGLPVPGVPTNPNPARILNMSLGSTIPIQECSASYSTAVAAVRGAGAIIVAAAGNKGQTLFGESGFYEPSGCAGVLAVGATDHLGFRSVYSNWSTEFVVDLSAPGGDITFYGVNTAGIYSTTDSGVRSPQGPNGKWSQGTSQAAPHVSATLALMLSARPSLTNSQLIYTLIETTREFPTASSCYRDSLCGWGMLNTHAALLRATTDPANAPTQTTVASSNNPAVMGTDFVITATVSPTNVTGTVTFLIAQVAVPGCSNLAVVNGSAGCRFSNFPVSATGYPISAVYNGDYTHHWAYSPQVVQHVVATAPVTATAVEYYHAAFDHYFITAISDEITKLDSGVFAGWARTGQGFKVYVTPQSGLAAVCRFFSTAFGPKSSHFYAPRGLGCEGTLANKDWSLEGDVFYTPLPSATGACPSGTVPVYRLYNNGKGGAPNHRFTTSQSVRSQMLSAGYIAEGAGIGVGMCSPV